ncbi:ribosome biogenesis protein ytm1 [Elasticomyces elasticus]|nr:ribosome biogenesis protein ytm1 [Elasticomyces elasticus]KAK4970034.1 ribosome biogenesis protein ytm1 [Elasticomyces elasticus]
MAADTVTPAILQYIDRHAYPESEDVASADLGTNALSSLLQAIHNAQTEVEQEVKALSKNTAPDIDTWISRAKDLQADILRSRETARQIVLEHETGRDLRAQGEEAGRKVKLLEKEVAFEESLAVTLEHIAHANRLLDAAQEHAVRGDVDATLRELEDADGSIAALEGLKDTRACGLLQGRAKQLRESMIETVTDYWNGFVQVDHEERIIVIAKKLRHQFEDTAAPDFGIELPVKGAQGLGILEGLVHKLSRDIERTVLRPRLTVDDEGQVAKIEVSGDQLSCRQRHVDTTHATLFTDLHHIIDFFASHLPSEVGIMLSESLVPALSLRLEEHWLEPAIPLSIQEMPAFQDVLAHVSHLADLIERHRWHGTKQLRVWVQNAPRTWLTKRREAVLGDVRNLVFAGLRETKVVERVETRMVSKDDHQALQGGGGDGEEGDDEWDTAWDEPEEAKSAVAAGKVEDPVSLDDDEASAWDTDDLDDKQSTGASGVADEADAWGWGDDAQTSSNPTVTKKTQQPPAALEVSAAHNVGDRAGQPSKEREMTLRETFTVTAVPDDVLDIVQHIISDAQTLAGPSYSSSPIAPAATGLYSIPTLALAIYRATAPTAYTNSLPTGNMLIYNDAGHLASRLREWQAAQPPASRLRLDNDVKALETFAKRAYGAEMESQRTILRDLLDGAQGFASVTQPPYKQGCEDAVQQTVDQLREVQKQWKGILSDGALSQSLGSLLGSVTGKMITDIEDLGDIGEADSHQLRHLMDIVSGTKDMFVRDEKADGVEEAPDMTFIYCPNWLKFQYLGEILESSLADIKYLWNEGELSLEFDGEEVVELIEGLFADSDIRRRAIQEIRRSGR